MSFSTYWYQICLKNIDHSSKALVNTISSHWCDGWIGALYWLLINISSLAYNWELPEIVIPKVFLNTIQLLTRPMSQVNQRRGRKILLDAVYLRKKLSKSVFRKVNWTRSSLWKKLSGSTTEWPCRVQHNISRKLKTFVKFISKINFRNTISERVMYVWNEGSIIDISSANSHMIQLFGKATRDRIANHKHIHLTGYYQFDLKKHLIVDEQIH